MSPYGAMDMSGNVFEWVHDFYDVEYYARSPYANPPGSDVVNHDWDSHRDYTGPLFVIRGGSYRPNWYYARTAHRHWGHHSDGAANNDEPYFRNNQVGFRCARSIPE